MGGVVNPISFRLGWSRIWDSSWALTSGMRFIKYSFLVRSDLAFKSFLMNFIHHSLPFEILFKPLQIIRHHSSQVSIFIFYNIAWLDWLWDEFNFLTWRYKSTRRSPNSHFFFNKLIFKSDPLNYDALKRFFFIQYNLNIVLLKILIFQVYNRIFRLWYFQYYSKLIKQLTYRFFNLTIDVFFLSWSRLEICAISLVYYMVGRLERFYSLNYVIRSVRFLLNHMFKAEHIEGYKLMYKGRFFRLGRRGRATYRWEKKQALPLSSTTALISYGSLNVRLKYSTCGLKVWLLHN